MLGSSAGMNDYVTQDELAALSNNLRALIYSVAASSTTAFTNPQIAANGNGVYYGEAAAPITQLPASYLSGLSASQIPALNYLSSSGGTLSGAFADSSTASAYFAGALGIGTTSPTALLTLDSTSTTGTILRLSNGSAGGRVWDFLETGSANTGGAGRLDIFDKTAGAARLSVTSAGNIGIGTTSPASPLSVLGELTVTDTQASSTATLGLERILDGGFTSDPSSTWTLGSGWTWDSVNSRISYSGSGGPIALLNIDSGGSGYTNGDTITISGGSGDATYTATVSSGKVTNLTQVSPGTTYTTGTGVSTTGGTGSGLVVSIKQIADSSNTLSQTITTSPSDPTGTYTTPEGSGDLTWNGTPYRLSFTIQNYSGNGQIKVTFGPSASGAAHLANTSQYYSGNGTYISTLLSTSTVVTFTPTGDFVGAVTSVSAKPITPLAATMTINNGDGSPGIEVRPGGVSEYSMFIGLRAGNNYATKSITDEGFNTAVGYQSMYSNTDGDHNTALGIESLFSNTKGSNNVAVGSYTLYGNTSGSSNTAVGFYSLFSNTSGAQNTAIGYQSLFFNTTGVFNTAVGFNSLGDNTTGGNNSAFGYDALFGNKTGGNNVSIGYQSLFSNTTGGNNVALGYLAETANTTGSSNIAVGYRALQSNTTGTQNVAVGLQSLQNATSSPNNTALGFDAMQGKTTGSFTISGTNNVAVGLQALQNYIDGSSNVAIGVSAMANATTSASNVAIGFAAGKGSSTNDSYQGLTAVGYQAGNSLNNNSGYNTLVGYQAGFGITTGSNNIWLGTATSSTGIANLTTGSQNILIGNNISLPSASANGQLDIGNILFGTGITSTGSTLSTGNIGIGTTTPWAQFSINPNGTAGPAFAIGSSTATRLLVTSGGLVGIGTTNPYARLSVWGADAASSTLAFNVVNSASTTVFAVFDGGNAQLSGTLTQSSDQRLKTNIEPLDASSTLALIDQLNPVTFNWIDPDQDSNPQLGFIAQQVQQIFPDLVSTTSPTTLTPDGTLGLNYIGLISPIVKSIQALYADVQGIEQTIADFSQKFTTNQLCVNKSDGTPVCVTGDQLSALLSTQGQQETPSPSPDSGPATTTPPTISIDGDNPAVISVGATYADLGATAADAQGHSLDVQTFLNGVEAPSITVDTSEAATDTIEYIATDTWGNTSTSSRIVIIEAAAQ